MSDNPNRPVEGGWCYTCGPLSQLIAFAAQHWHTTSLPQPLSDLASTEAVCIQITHGFPETIANWGPGQVAILRAVADRLTELADMASWRPSTGLGIAASVDEDLPQGDCPGCIGRGTGTRCCACDRTIPQHLRRTREDSPSEVRNDCPDCLAGKTHTHGGAL